MSELAGEFQVQAYKRLISGSWFNAPKRLSDFLEQPPVEAGDVVIALCHLKRESIEPRPGQRVRVGAVVGLCGNSGNSTEPHVHVQAIDGRDVGRAGAVRLTFHGELPRNGDLIEVQDKRPLA